MSEEDAANLVDMGLTLLQARVYLVLLRLGTTRAPRLASVVGVVRPEIYRILRELSARGLVHRSLTSPSTYMAASPNVAVPLLAQQIRERLASFELKSNALMKSLTSITPEHSGVMDHRITLLEAFDRANQEFKQMVTEAEDEYVGITGRDALNQLSNDDLVRPIISASKRKVKVRIITEIDRDNAKVAEQLSRHVELRTSQNILFYIDIVDRKKMLFGPAYLQSDQAIKRRELDLLTTDPRFIAGMHAMFERIWETCPKYAKRRR